jgi:hypothetical protein
VRADVLHRGGRVERSELAEVLADEFSLFDAAPSQGRRDVRPLAPAPALRGPELPAPVSVGEHEVGEATIADREGVEGEGVQLPTVGRALVVERTAGGGRTPQPNRSALVADAGLVGPRRSVATRRARPVERGAAEAGQRLEHRLRVLDLVLRDQALDEIPIEEPRIARPVGMLQALEGPLPHGSLQGESGFQREQLQLRAARAGLLEGVVQPLQLGSGEPVSGAEHGADGPAILVDRQVPQVPEDRAQGLVRRQPESRGVEPSQEREGSRAGLVQQSSRGLVPGRGGRGRASGNWLRRGGGDRLVG